MEKQYWIGEFHVDLSRNQIAQPGLSHNLPPKALQVLTYLAKNQGRVVGYDELLDQVWPNAVVTANTLQRCITLLRKALGENRKAQSIIKTHAKQGYSLECEVRWVDKTVQDTSKTSQDSGSHAGSNKGGTKDGTTEKAKNDNSTNDITAKDSFDVFPKKANQSRCQELASRAKRDTVHNRIYIVLATALLLLVAVVSQWQDSSQPLQFSELRYLTATDDNEFGAKYSPDGQYIMFNRFYGKMCINNIWAKNTETLQETQLTHSMGTTQGHALSPDGSTLVFVQQDDCTKPILQERCYRLMQIDFHQALAGDQAPTELLGCQRLAITSPVWLDDQHIALMQRHEQRWRVIKYNLMNNTSSVFYQLADGQVSSFAWSENHQLFAISTFKRDGSQHIDMVLPSGEVKSSHAIQLPENSPEYLKIRPQFTPIKGQLIFTFGNELYRLTETGKANKIPFPFDTALDTAYFHPNGDRLLLVKGNFDSDVARFTIATPNQPNSQPQGAPVEYSVFGRSTASEHLATFQPSTGKVAFVSAQTGTEQIWLQDENDKTLISSLPNGSFVQHLIWSLDGNELLAYANWQMHLLSLQSKHSTYDFPYLVADLFHWDSAKQSVLANILVDGVRKFVNIDLNTLEYQIVSNKKIIWAGKSDLVPLIYMDEQGDFWQPGAVEDQLVAPLSGHAHSRKLLLKGQLLYGINPLHQLWQFDLEKQGFTILANLPPDIDYLTDVRDNEVLVTLVAEVKKEVIELSLTKH